MSITNSITKLLNMEDNNLIFNEDFIEERKINKKRSLIVNGYLYNTYDNCPKCGCVNNNSIIKKGIKTCLIKINTISGLDSYLNLKKQIYLCKQCNKRFVSQSNIVDYRCRISNNVKKSIINMAKEVMTKTLIAKFHNVCDNTIQRTFDAVYSTKKIYKNYLPIAICIDEFTYKKKTMAFNICNAITGKTIDLIEDRTTANLEKYFSHYLEETRNKVKFVVMDMYSPYLLLIKKWFPNAKIIIDLFHIVQLLSKSLNKTRINVMKENKDDYKKYKRYWRLILKSHFDLNANKWTKFICFKNLMTEVDVVNYLINKDEILNNTYNIYQDILYYLQHREYNGFINSLSINNKEISSQMITTINTLNNFAPYIKNTLEYSYNNGVMERNNNTCKLIKRISFGFKNFNNFKSRILIITNIFRKQKQEYHTNYSIPVSLRSP